MAKNKNLFKLILVVIAGIVLLATAGVRTFGKAKKSADTQMTQPSADVPDRLEIPRCTESRAEQVIEHTGYTVSYNSDWCTPNWVAYELTKDETYGHEERTDHFDPDPDVKGVCPTYRDYSRSGYDRGHMAPAGDMKWDETAMRESFYLSNICPQDHNLNKGDWNTLEEKARYWARKFGNVYIVCGPIMSKNPETIGYNNVAVPDAFYKVFLTQINGEWQTIGFVFQNQPGERPLISYCKSVDDIEKITGIDFFPSLDDNIEDQIEAHYSASLWGLR